MSNTAVKYDGETISATPLRCRSWLCEHCNPWRKMLLVKEAMAGKPRTFITLTSNPKHLTTPEERAKALVAAWRHIVRTLRLQKRFAGLQYIAVIEKTERGEPHLHILARMPFLKQAWLSTEMAKLTDAPIVDIRQIKSAASAAHYVAKYVGKDPHRYEGCKRYWKSQDYMHPTRTELKKLRDMDIEFHLVTLPFNVYRGILRAMAWSITKDVYNHFEVHAPPEVRGPPNCKPHWRYGANDVPQSAQ